MRYILLLLPFIYFPARAQQTEKAVAISCYANPELYLQASVIAYVSDKAGDVACSGRYVSIHNKSRNLFYYKANSGWIAVKPQGSAIILVPGTSNSSASASVLNLTVRYIPDASGDIDSKIKAIARMNAQSDQAKAGKPGVNLSKEHQDLGKHANQKLATAATKPPVRTTAGTLRTQAAKKGTTKQATASAPSKTPPRQVRREPEQKPAGVKSSSALTSAVGLRVDFGNGPTGLGPNVKYRFNRKNSIDASLVFFEGGVVGLGAQLEQSFAVRSAAGLNWYIGIGPQFLFGDEDTEIALVPVTGLEYNIPGAPLNLSFDWRPSFYLSEGTEAEAGRFGLSLRIAF